MLATSASMEEMGGQALIPTVCSPQPVQPKGHTRVPSCFKVATILKLESQIPLGRTVGFLPEGGSEGPPGYKQTQGLQSPSALGSPTACPPKHQIQSSGCLARLLGPLSPSGEDTRCTVPSRKGGEPQTWRSSLPPALLNSLCVRFGRRADPGGHHQLCGEGAAVAESPGRDPHDHCRLSDLV